MKKYRSQFNIIDGIVMDNNDPQQMGRVKVWCPAIDGDTYKVDVTPWASYVTPLAGQTSNYPAGSRGTPTEGFHSYGFWAIPKVGASVVIGLMYGDVNRRYYLGSVFDDHGNRSLPTGRNREDYAPSPVSDTFDPVEPQTSNLNVQFSGDLKSSQAQTRGAYERSVAQDADVKDGTQGYQKSPNGPELDPQTYCLSTPGRHTIVFQDNPTNSRLRLKSADGHQIIFDDANERIYISTAKGNSYIELDSDGHVHVYAAESLSFSAGGDINFSTLGNFTVGAGGNIDLGAKGHGRFSACEDLSLSGGPVNIESSGVFNILAAGNLIQTGSKIHLNGPGAGKAECADKPTITPDHEPWTRPATKGTRGKNWKE